jgi:hypothetical protein
MLPQKLSSGLLPLIAIAALDCGLFAGRQLPACMVCTRRVSNIGNADFNVWSLGILLDQLREDPWL